MLRIFFGIILFANGLAKLLSFSSFTIGPYSANLVNLPITRAILATDGGQRTQVPLVNGLVNDVIIPNWGFFQWVITAFELGVGALLILGLATRGAALLGSVSSSSSQPCTSRATGGCSSSPTSMCRSSSSPSSRRAAPGGSTR